MITLRKSLDRGHANHGWLDSYHTFSFADYYDPNHMNCSVLRVINEDKIDAGTGFGTHGHQEMEIITYIIEGALEHKDSMGNQTIIKPGEVQRMSAGTGIKHSEYNPSIDLPVHLLQIWLLPEKKAITPSYDQKSFTEALLTNKLVLVASKDGLENSVSINQDVKMYACRSKISGVEKLTITPNRTFWIQLIKGSLSANDLQMKPGDGATFKNEEFMQLLWQPESEFIIFDLP